MENEYIVCPGTSIGIAEEAMGGKGAYAENEEILSSLAGRVVREHGELKVLPKKDIMKIVAGQVVFGIVADVMENLALIDILSVSRGMERFVPPQDYGVLRVMNIRDGFVPSAKNEMKRGDVIKAKVGEVAIGISLTTKEFDLGVIKAYCAACRHEMDLSRNVLKCRHCGRMDAKRKLSRTYGAEVMLSEIKQF